jgi:hypothetical protein
MSINGYYYLHINGDLIWKPYMDTGQTADFRESDFVKAFWPLDVKNRGDAWCILIESSVLGANKEKIHELAQKWKCDDEDAFHFAEYAGFVIEKDGTAFVAKKKDFVNLQESPAGFGDTAFDAIVALVRELKFQYSKTWGGSVFDLFRDFREFATITYPDPLPKNINKKPVTMKRRNATRRRRGQVK